MADLVAIPLAGENSLLYYIRRNMEKWCVFLCLSVKLNLRVARKARAMLDALMGPDLGW